jgi:hypothetical protein
MLSDNSTLANGSVIRLRRKAPSHMSHLPERGERGCTTAPKIRKLGIRKNNPPTKVPATAVKHPVTTASQRVLMATTSSV